MNWSHVIVAEHRHADLLVEAANHRLVGGNRQVAGERQPASREPSRRLFLPWRPAAAR